MNLYEKLNRLDDSLVESKRVVKKKKLTEGIWAYQTYIEKQPGEKQPSKSLTYGNHFIMSRSPYRKERFGPDWKRHIDKIIEWCQENNPGLIRSTHDFRLDNFGKNVNTPEAFIGAIEHGISKGEYELILNESVEGDKKKLFDAAASVKCKLDDDTIEYAMYDVDDFIENELVYCGKLLLSECPDMLFWRYVSDENFGSYCAVYESDEEFADAFYQISHDRVYDITDEVNGDYDYDDDIDELLTESVEDINRREGFLKEVFTKQEIIDLAEAHTDFTGKTYNEAFNYVLNNWDNFYFEDDYEAFCDELDHFNEMLTENRWNPYFTPYGYKDAAKVLNGKAPTHYYHLKEIEMDRGDGIKLAKYALRKGLPVMVDKNSDPDYPEFAIKGEYHWNDYFYPYPTAHEEDLIAWDGNMFTEQSLTEGVVSTIDFETIAKQIIDYTREHPEAIKLADNINDYINDLNCQGVWYIPAAIGDFVAEDPDNITEQEADEFIEMLINETKLDSRLKDL